MSVTTLDCYLRQSQTVWSSRMRTCSLVPTPIDTLQNPGRMRRATQLAIPRFSQRLVAKERVHGN